MANYKNGKIYKIESFNRQLETDTYIGSTTKNNLYQIMYKHISSYKRWKLGKAHKKLPFDIFDKYGIDNCVLIVLEMVDCNSKDELLAREQHYIKSMKCLNKQN